MTEPLTREDIEQKVAELLADPGPIARGVRLEDFERMLREMFEARPYVDPAAHPEFYGICREA